MAQNENNIFFLCSGNELPQVAMFLKEATHKSPIFLYLIVFRFSSSWDCVCVLLIKVVFKHNEWCEVLVLPPPQPVWKESLSHGDPLLSACREDHFSPLPVSAVQPAHPRHAVPHGHRDGSGAAGSGQPSLWHRRRRWRPQHVRDAALWPSDRRADPGPAAARSAGAQRGGGDVRIRRPHLPSQTSGPGPPSDFTLRVLKRKSSVDV